MKIWDNIVSLINLKDIDLRRNNTIQNNKIKEKMVMMILNIEVGVKEEEGDEVEEEVEVREEVGVEEEVVEEDEFNNLFKLINLISLKVHKLYSKHEAYQNNVL